MGRTLGFFDFNQSHGGSRQNSANGLKHPRNHADFSTETLEGHKSSGINREEKQCTCEVKKTSATKMKAGGMPIKKLIAEEMSKEADSKCRTPSVIARLMGLDTLPTQSLLTNQSKEEEKHAQKKLSWKHQQQSKSAPDTKQSKPAPDTKQSKPAPDTKNFSQKANPLERKPNQFLSSTKSQQYAFDNPGAERIPQAHPCSNNPHKKQQQKFKEDFGTCQTSKFQEYSRPFQSEKFNIQGVGYQMPKHEKLSEGKMALVRQKFMDAKRLATDVNLQQSKEFLDAVEMLQSNKEAFLEFIEQPNALFAKQLKDLDTTSQPHSQLKQITVLKSSNPTRTYKEDKKKQRPLKKGETNEKHTRKLMELRDLGGKNKLCQGQSVTRMLPVGSVPDGHKQSTSGSKVENGSSSVPTRIVVLKPGPGRAQNFQSGSAPSSSPQYETCIRDPKDMDQTRSQDYLQDVRIRLEMEISKNKDKSRRFMNGVENQVGNESKYQREIATEIARHVSESLSRDLMHDSPSDLLSSAPDSPGNISLSRSENVYEDMDQEVYTPVSKLSWDSADRFSLGSPSISARSDSSESTVNREAKRRLLERWRSTHGNFEQQQQQQRASSTLAEILALPERKNHVLCPRGPKEIDKPAKEREVQQQDDLKLKSKNKKPMRHDGAAEWEFSLGQKNLDDNDNMPPKNLHRSSSVPTSDKTSNRGSIEMHGKELIADARNAHDMNHDRSSNSLDTESIKSKSGKSTKGKASSMKRHFLMRGKWSNSKQSDSLEFEPAPNLHLQSEQGLSVSMRHMASESREQMERTECRSSLVQQEPCELLIDAPEATTESDDCSTSAASDISAVDEDGCKQPRFESSARDPTLVKCEIGSSSVEANCVRRGISSTSQPEFPTPCSPIKKLPEFENPVPESNTDKGEHPSPVSVLDSPFEEEYPSPKDFKEISSNLHELRLQLRLLKSDGSASSVHRSANLLDCNSLHLKDCKIGDVVATVRGNTFNTMSETETTCLSNSKLSSIEKFKYESLDIDDILWSEEQLPDLLYIRTVLIASGYTGDPNTIFARWHSPNYPLDPHLFDQIEDKDDTQSEARFSETELTEVDASSTIKAYRSKSERHLLFDCINEALLEILGPFLNYHPWVRPTKMSLRPIASGKQLLKETWTRICNHLYTQPEVRYSLENLVKGDLSREATWMELRGDVEMVGNEIEKTIFKDLIEDVLYDIIS